ncbi:MAG: LysR family transcriptional regulator [Pseudomonadales bacterium]|jgi:DNA-binding transcriptional LysR family regulator|nr:LysR family transcriptional regulator [Pseudomonadales bacterium]
MRYTLRQLQVFLAIAHQQNVSKAAVQLNLSQSAASSALKELEQQFDLQLFDRIGKRLQLNEQGRLIRPKAERLLAEAVELEQALSEQADTSNLRVGATLTIGNYLAVNIMAEMMRQQPDAHINLEVANTSTISQKVLNYDLDIGLIEGELQNTDLEVTPWRDDELAVFCSPEHPLVKKVLANRRITDKDLLAVNWILREAGSGTQQTFERAMHGILPNLKIVHELQHTEAIKRAVEANLGIGCLSEITLKEEFERGTLVRLPVPQRNFKRSFYFIIHNQKFQSAGIHKWISLCKSS